MEGGRRGAVAGLRGTAMHLPTVKIVNRASDVGWCIINKADFDAQTQTLWQEEAQELTRESIAKMKKADVVDLLVLHGFDPDRRRSVAKLRNDLIAVMFIDA